MAPLDIIGSKMPNHDAADNSSATLLANDSPQHTTSNTTTPSAQQNTQATVPQSQNVIKSGIRRGATMLLNSDQLRRCLSVASSDLSR
ncbi:hypothetical protein B0O99DRAFT_60892 [Bisporella sp. PMI_857]|nr:hypothetical protein B0O99DRAFT_60892 [Bisporella sp. PMI_857]